MKYKNFFIYLLFLAPWLLSSVLVNSDISYYNSLSKPFFALPGYAYAIIWIILYILISYSVYKVWFKSNSTYRIYLFINYIANELYTFVFFSLRDNFIALVDTIIIFISSLYLYIESKNIDKLYSNFLLPYVLFSAFALLLTISIFILN